MVVVIIRNVRDILGGIILLQMGLVISSPLPAFPTFFPRFFDAKAGYSRPRHFGAKNRGIIKSRTMEFQLRAVCNKVSLQRCQANGD